MAEYIDKVDLVKRLESRVKDYGRDCNSNAPITSRTYQAVLHMVEYLPTADVVPVVRCKDCVYCVDLGTSGLYCDHDDNRNPLGCRPNDYCNDGERRGSNE